MFQHKDPLQVMIQHVRDVPRPLHVLDPAGRPPDGTALAEALEGV